MIRAVTLTALLALTALQLADRTIAGFVQCAAAGTCPW